MFKNKQGQIRSGWKILGVLAATIGGLGITSIIYLIIIRGVLPLTGDLNVNTMEYSKRGKQIYDTLTIIMQLIQEIIMIAIPVLAWRNIIKRPLFNMGLKPIKNHYIELLAGLLLGTISMTAVFCILIFSNNATVDTWTPHFSADIIIYLIAFILVGFAEEIFGRGYIMSVLRQTRSIPVIIIVSALVFSALHAGNPGVGLLPFVNIALVGILFAYMYLKSGNIWMSIGYHITWNYFQGNIFGFKVSGLDMGSLLATNLGSNKVITGGSFGPEGGIVVTLVILLGFVFIKMYYRKTEYNFLSEEPELPNVEAAKKQQVEDADKQEA